MVREKTKKGSKAVWEYVSGSEEETRTLGERMAHCLKPGDVVEIEISGIGTLRNPVVADV